MAIRYTAHGQVFSGPRPETSLAAHRAAAFEAAHHGISWVGNEDTGPDMPGCILTPERTLAAGDGTGAVFDRARAVWEAANGHAVTGAALVEAA